MAIYYEQLVHDLSGAVWEVVKRVYGEPEPSHYYHYSKDVDMIVKSRNLWATCIADQVDQTELTHGLQLVSAAADGLLMSAMSHFDSWVLRNLAGVMSARRRYTYIACFCAEDGSLYHKEKFGSSCIEIECSALHRMHCGALDASCWLQPVLYSDTSQRTAVAEAMRAVVYCLGRYVSAESEGPGVENHARRCARVISDVLLGLLTGFKAAKYSEEKDWRLICHPRLNPLSTAPSQADRDFCALVATAPRRHIKLSPLVGNVR